MPSFVALLRGINVGGRNKIAMADLRALAEDLGWSAVWTYIQSGNVIFEAESDAFALEQELEHRIQRDFGFPVPVIVRSTVQWKSYSGSNPFPEAAANEANRLLLYVPKQAPLPGAESALRERARDGEAIAIVGDALWIHFPGGSGRSKLSPALIDRLLGSPSTSRNWRTVLKLQEMLQQG
jgi:uncharacterized protein (DUF1697 family)